MFKVNKNAWNPATLLKGGSNTGVVLVILLLVLNIFHTYFFSGFFVDFEQVNVSWEESQKKKI